jgi:hypothetical protein
VNGDSTSAYPRFHPQPSLDAYRLKSRSFKVLLLSRDHLVEVFVGVEVERGLDARMTQDALHGLRVFLCLVHKPIRVGITIPAFFAAGRKWTRQNTDAQIGTLPLLLGEANTKSVGFA